MLDGFICNPAGVAYTQRILLLNEWFVNYVVTVASSVISLPTTANSGN